MKKSVIIILAVIAVIVIWAVHVQRSCRYG